jgi:uncharacterized protein (DUF2236 family)
MEKMARKVAQIASRHAPFAAAAHSRRLQRFAAAEVYPEFSRSPMILMRSMTYWF